MNDSLVVILSSLLKLKNVLLLSLTGLTDFQQWQINDILYDY